MDRSYRISNKAPRHSRKHAIRTPKAAELLANHFRRRIIRGELKEGDRLPKEEILLEQYGVARSTLREAFRLLEADGLLSISRGARSGALIRRPAVDAATRQMNILLQSRNITLDDIYWAITIIEPAVVRSLAERATKADISALRKLIAKTYKTMDDDHRYGENAAEFYRALAERAGPKSLAVTMELLTSLVGAYIELASGGVSPRQIHANKVAVMKTKEKLVDLLEKHDPDRAEALWRKCLETTRENMFRWQPSKAVEDVFF